MTRKRIQTKTPNVQGGGEVTPGTSGIVEDFSLKIIAPDTNVAPSDDGTFQITILQADTNATPDEGVSLSFPDPDFPDTNVAPSDARTALLRVWLANSAGAGVTNPTNANGVNDGARAAIATAVAGSTTETLTSDIGVSIGAGLTFSSAIYRGWFNCTRPLPTSTVVIIAHSTSALFSDITLFSGTGTENHDSGDFTVDLVALGIDTLAKLQSLQILHRTTDAAAGVSPATINVDAGAVDIVATSI